MGIGKMRWRRERENKGKEKNKGVSYGKVLIEEAFWGFGLCNDDGFRSYGIKKPIWVEIGIIVT